MKLSVIGVDISKEWFDIQIFQNKHEQRFEQNQNGFKRFLKCLKKFGIKKARVCMEATGLYFEKLAEFLHEKGHEVVVVNPQCIRAFSCSELRRSKSDRLDAQLIARFCKQKYDELYNWEPMPAHFKEVRELIRRRETLIGCRTGELNRLQAGFSSKPQITSIKRIVTVLNEEIDQLERLIAKIIDSNEDLKIVVDLAESIKGIGRLTAVTVLVEVPKVLWDGRLAAAFAGLVPAKETSGKSAKSARISRVGSKRLRYVLYMPAVVASQKNPLLKDFYDRLVARGLKKQQAITAVMRKLLHLIFGVLRTRKPFDCLYETKRRARLITA